MVVSLKPFGCMPSTQSDGVMAALSANSRRCSSWRSRRRARAKRTRTAACRWLWATHAGAPGPNSTSPRFHRPLARGDPRAMSRHRDLRRPFHLSPPPGVAGTAAQFIRHVGSLMKRESSRRLTPAATMDDSATGLHCPVDRRQIVRRQEKLIPAILSSLSHILGGDLTQIAPTHCPSTRATFQCIAMQSRI